MDYIIAFGDIVEENGKTIRENNMEKGHNIPVGALVEVTYDDWHGGGACSKTHARLWVVKQGRDCDGTPLYWLSKTKLEKQDPVQIHYPDGFDGQPFGLTRRMSQKIHYEWKGGFQESSLKVIEITEDLKKGVGALSWE